MKTKGLRMGVLAVATALVMTGCGEKNGGGKVEDELSVPTVDMTEVQKAFAQKPKDGEDEFDLHRRQVESLFPETVREEDDTSIDIWLMEGRDGLIELSEYANSKHPYLAQAADAYNAARIGWGVWSNFEVYVNRDFDLQEEVIEATKKVDVDDFGDERFGKPARQYKQGMLELFVEGEEKWTEEKNPSEEMEVFMENLHGVHYVPWAEHTDSMVVLLQMSGKRQEALSDNTYQRYQKAEKESRGVEEALSILQGSESFAHQCSFWLRWANTKVDGDDEDFWILASGSKLLKSGLYNPELFRIWAIWRAMYQMEFGGMSRSSEIPNAYYNEVREICYRTCLKWIEKHPDDMVAMNCASLLSGRSNLNRYGENPFGNEGLTELLNECPGRMAEEEDTGE